MLTLDRQQSPVMTRPQPVVAAPRITLGRRDPSAPASARIVMLVDARLPSGQAQLLAWDVVCQGEMDLSTWLCRSASGDYFLFCRSGSRSDLPADIVPLSPMRAATWFDAHPTHLTDFAERDFPL